MTRWQLITAVLALGASTGCHSKFLRTANEALERENFQLEQRLDAVTWELEDARAALEACRCGSGGNAAPAGGGAFGGLGGRGGSSDNFTTPPSTFVPGSSGPSRGGRSDSFGNPPSRGPADGGGDKGPAVDRPPDVQLPFEESRLRRRREPVPRYNGPPEISPPDPSVPEGFGKARQISTRPASDAPPPYAPANENRNDLDEAPSFTGTADTGRAVVSEVVVNSALTMWRKSGPNDSDGGLRVVFEPHDAAGNTVAAHGNVAIVVLDPTRSGAAARVARWDFTPDDLPRHFKGAKPGGGLHFSLSWPATPPTADDLLLFVRLTTTDGQQFVGEHVLRPHTGAAPASWTEDSEDDSGGPALAGGAAASPAADTRWRRAATPLVARQPVRHASNGAAAASAVAPLPEPEMAPALVPDDAGPAMSTEPNATPWEPYR